MLKTFIINYHCHGTDPTQLNIRADSHREAFKIFSDKMKAEGKTGWGNYSLKKLDDPQLSLF